MHSKPLIFRLQILKRNAGLDISLSKAVPYLLLYHESEPDLEARSNSQDSYLYRHLPLHLISTSPVKEPCMSLYVNSQNSSPVKLVYEGPKL